MQGFELMLKAMGIDPQKMAEEAVAKFGPELEKFKVGVVETIKNEVIAPMAENFAANVTQVLAARDQALLAKLETMDAALRSAVPGYEPMVVDLTKVTNPATPEGGPVDMAALDQERLAQQGSVQEQEAMPTGQVDVEQPQPAANQEQAPSALQEHAEVVQEGEAANQVQEPDPFAGHREGDQVQEAGA